MYFVTTITNLVPQNTPFSDPIWKKHSHRCVGYYEDLETAVMRVEQNACDINETIYDFAVIEKIGSGMYAQPDEEAWFRFNDGTDRYERIEKPEETEQTCNWAIG